MIIPAQGLRIVLAVRPVDFRCGHDALAGLVQNTLGLDPHSGLIVVFRSKRADRLKILLWDGTGLVLVYKRLGRDGRFEWPQISDGVMHLTRELEASGRTDCRDDASCGELTQTRQPVSRGALG
ncbi:IS66 family insertion sequence element accessory protein TnpB (plasmid) [Bradyrhizobium barranii subsp. barranii]|uniref:IS66 family insertion sequence element accessory protein TnpB n=1 Tax=Bradyrhizobium barranii subsp. barranii TaxID=2823807 RepID=A0A939MG56_9BRAD|nr:IS66 family insertion sequence element accessory protein TnpB [Bradyrhizobium barranii]UEM16317.1 IS66 family insertion sequence element accessory protein TnpB [Bradyrhizobium barranii subsp. barranii]UEM18252.1 IS66 family insertion sequence element accessory protein TnpB [Bradyrhizobium barranii subsp. barranii]